MKTPLFLLAFPFALQVAAQPLAAPVAETSTTEISSDIPGEIMEMVDPSVVSIQHERAGGTGFFISEDGFILSNGHVVRGNDAEDPTQPAKSITVILNDERKFPAKVLGFSMDPDVALLKIEADTPFQPVKFADSRTASVGMKCFAVGTPTGLRRTFTSGILSSVDRTDLNTETVVFQIDAAINPGNSGGPLFDQQGHVLGINTYGYQGRNNLGFTIPIHVAEAMVDDLKTRGRFVRSVIPHFLTSELYDELVKTLDVKQGVLVSWVMPGSEAESIGLKSGDILTAINGEPVNARNKADLLRLEWEQSVRSAGEKMKLTVMRGEAGKRKEMEFETELREMEPLPKFGLHAGEIVEHRYANLGLGLKELVSLHHLIHQIPSEKDGVMVHFVESNSTAARSGLQRLDVIHQVGETQVSSLEEFRVAFEKALLENRGAIPLHYSRRKLEYVTAIAPDYTLKGKKVVLLAPQDDHEFVDVMYRELVAKGADIEICVPGKKSLARDGLDLELKADLDVAAGRKLEEVDLLLIAGGDGASDLLKEEEALAWVAERIEAKQKVATVGRSGLIPVMALKGELDLKITLPSEDSSKALGEGANYTGYDMESDGPLHTCTGEERDVIRKFINKVSNDLVM